MTKAFQTIIDRKKAAITKILEGINELDGLKGEDLLNSKELVQCNVPEVMYLTSLDALTESLRQQARFLKKMTDGGEDGAKILAVTMKDLGKDVTSIGGASFGW